VKGFQINRRKRIADCSEPGFGNSSARKVTEDYAQENINIAMLEMLKHTGRNKAVWIGNSCSHPT
jgi:hypothetical protein